MKLTDAQKKTIEALKGRWSSVGKPVFLPCDDCVLIQVYSESTGVRMHIGIEVDGQAHS